MALGWQKNQWDPNAKSPTEVQPIKDSHGNVLTDGDMVVVIKDLKVKRR